MRNFRCFGNFSYFAIWAVPIVLLALSWPAVSPARADSNSCVDCHQSQEFFVKNRKLYEYYQDWLSSPHRVAGVVCNECHGGDPTAVDKDQAHGGALDPSDAGSRVFFRNQIATCGECHGAETEQFTKSRHYRRLQEDANAPTCSTCHRVMNRKPYYTDIVEATCAVCHNAQNEEDLPVVVIDQAEDILQRLNAIKGYLFWSLLYYHSKDAPPDGKQQLASFETAYHEIILMGHRFNLEKTDELSVELLTDLKRLYRETAEDAFSAGE